jgi:hypothetical protein
VTILVGFHPLTNVRAIFGLDYQIYDLGRFCTTLDLLTSHRHYKRSFVPLTTSLKYQWWWFDALDVDASPPPDEKTDGKGGSAWKDIPTTPRQGRQVWDILIPAPSITRPLVKEIILNQTSVPNSRLKLGNINHLATISQMLIFNKQLTKCIFSFLLYYFILTDHTLLVLIS